MIPYVLVTLDGSNIKLAVLISHDNTMTTFGSPFFFVTLDNTNIKMVSTNVIFGSSFIYF